MTNAIRELMCFDQVFLRNTGWANNFHEWPKITGAHNEEFPSRELWREKFPWNENSQEWPENKGLHDEEFLSKELRRGQFPRHGNSHVRTRTDQRISRDPVLDRMKAQSEEQTVTIDPTVRSSQEVDLVQIEVTCEESTTWASSKGHFGHKWKMRLKPKFTRV